MTETEVFAALIEWNQLGNASPPWSHEELLHKAQSAMQNHLGKANGQLDVLADCAKGGCELGGDMRGSV